MSGAAGNQLSLRDAAIDVVRRLQEAGHTAYFAGGCVRDRLLGHEPEDYDVATDALPDAIKRSFKGTRRVGESFGVMLVRSHGHVIEVATFRADGTYSDHRHPDEVIFSNEHDDAARRDFTINGLYEDPIAGLIIDHVGGQADLEAGVIRAIGTPDARFEEDHLRMLRAIRFAARFQFEIETDTAVAISSRAGNLQGVSAERIGQEFRRMATNGLWGPAMRLASELQLAGVILGEVAGPSDWPRCDHLDSCDPPPSSTRFEAAMAAWLLDQGEAGEDCRELIGDRLVLSNQERARLDAILSVHERVGAEWEEAGVATCKRLASSAVFGVCLELIRAVDGQWAASIESRVEDLSVSGLSPDPLLGGADLLEAGIEAGPGLGRILDAVYDAQLEGELEDRESAIELALDLASRGFAGG